MRQIPIEKFKREMKAEIKNLPFEVTRRGVTLFVVNHAVRNIKIKETITKHVVKELETENSATNHVFGVAGGKKPLKKMSIPKWVNPLSNTILAPKK